MRIATDNARRLMRESGFEFPGKLEVVVDPDLPFMGYSTQRSGSNVIVVSGMAVKSGPIEGLLIHEMCHIYRTHKNHPSHNVKLLNNIGLHIIHEYKLTAEYQIKLVQQAVNHIQDLYADDISFKVFEKSKTFTTEQAFSFFLDWIQESPISSRSVKARWLNVGTLLNNCFALSNMIRHNVPDPNNQAQSRVEKFLSQTNEMMRKELDFFRNFMTSLKENTSEEEFQKDLSEYLTKTIQLAKL